MSCGRSEISALPSQFDLLTTTVEPREAMAVVAQGRWSTEFGPMVTRAGPAGDELTGFDELGLQRPPWQTYRDVCEGEGEGFSARQRIRRAALLHCGDLMANAKRTRLQKPAGWVFDQFEKPPAERDHMLNCIHFVRPDDTQCAAGERVASLPEVLQECNLATRWWPESRDGAFALFSMQGTSMSYHIDLWATAVFYAVLWGCKMFVVAPPTMTNLSLMRSWQEHNEDPSHKDFPAGLEMAQVAVLTQGMSLLLPSGWIHAVFTPVDSCVLGWNWLPVEQLPPALNIIRTQWGHKSAEIRQLKAFRTREFVRHLWGFTKELITKHQIGSGAGGAGGAGGAALPPAVERQLRSLLCYLRRRHLFADPRRVKNPPALLDAIETRLRASEAAAATADPSLPTAVDEVATADPSLPTAMEEAVTADPSLPTAMEEVATADPSLPTAMEEAATADPSLPTAMEEVATADPSLPTAVEEAATADPSLPTAVEEVATADPSLPTAVEEAATVDPSLPTAVEEAATADPSLPTAVDEAAAPSVAGMQDAHASGYCMPAVPPPAQPRVWAVSAPAPAVVPAMASATSLPTCEPTRPMPPAFPASFEPPCLAVDRTATMAFTPSHVAVSPPVNPCEAAAVLSSSTETAAAAIADSVTSATMDLAAEEPEAVSAEESAAVDAAEVMATFAVEGRAFALDVMGGATAA